ncbi:MAG: class I SAM-dependent methyltransferase [Firmicutes bacterium]|nr:class I SAM-dependent methyltransferase [Bacillota bacterium]
MLSFDGNKELSTEKYKWCGNLSDFVFGLDEKQTFFFKNILAKHRIDKVLDVFCGNGELAVLLAKWGKKVTVFVPEMLTIKEINHKSAQAGVQVEICLGDMRDISNLYRERCDLIACLQNALSRLLSEEDIWGTLAQMYLKLKPGGLLVIHTLNYDRLMQESACPIPVLEKLCLGLKTKLLLERGKKGDDTKLIFKIAPAGIRAGIRIRQEEIRVPVRPIFKKELDFWLTELGFENIKSYDWFSGEGAVNDTCHRVTLAYRPVAAAMTR